MKEWKAPEMVDLRIALTAGGHQRHGHHGHHGHGHNRKGGNKGGGSGHILATPIPTIAPFDDDSVIML